MKQIEYCGCCGRDLPFGGVFCEDCEKHLAPARHGMPDWERTYFAQHGADCPYQVAIDDRKATP